jgi:uncharacterized protein (TIRG00374 family)
MNKKKAFITVLQVLATVAIVAYLFRDPAQNRKMLDGLAHADKFWILASVAIYGAMELCAVARWQILLRVQGIAVGWFRLIGLVMIGLLFNLFMLGGTGGDVVKIFYLLKETPGKKPAALLAVLMDRVIGMVALMIIACGIISLRYHWLTQTKGTSWLLGALLAIFAASFAGIVGSFLLTSSGLVHKLPAKVPFRDKLLDLAAAYNMYGRSWGSTLAAMCLSIPIHFGSYTQFYCVARALPEAASKASLFDFFAIMPIVNTIACLPLTLSGAGVREWLFIKLLGDLCGIDANTAKLVSVVGFSVLVFWGMAGGIVYLFYRPSNHAPLSQIKRDVSALGHQIASATD